MIQKSQHFFLVNPRDFPWLQVLDLPGGQLLSFALERLAPQAVGDGLNW
jgi:hypothetical protein